MNCSKCGSRNPAEALHCIRCGAKLVSSNEADTFAGISLPPLPPSGDPTLPPLPPRPAPASSLNSMVTAGPWGAVAAAAPALDTVDFGPRYRIDRLLGQGGMGAVYKAYDKELDRPVALKLIRPDLASEPQAMGRFKQELLLASKISHKNILRIHDLGEANGVKFISMAYVHGQDLHGLLQRGRLSVDEAVHIIRQLCGALEAAHGEGVVHRDLKPQNVLLDEQRNVFITDFGLAKSLAVDTGMTMSGQYLGTPRYMAPEQVESHQNVDHRADLYALGLILFEMVTGDVPFHADTPLQLMYKRVHETPRSPAELNPDLPPWLVQIIVKSIERDPARRYQSARAMLNDIDAARAPSVMIPPPVDMGPETRRISIALPLMPWRKMGIGLAAVVVLLAVLLAIPGLRHRIFSGTAESSGPHKPITVLVADFTNHTGDPVFDRTLEPMLNTALEGASFINAYSRGDARKLAQKLPHPTDKLDEESARLVAVSQGINAVISGEITLRGDKYVTSALALDGVTGKVLASSEISVSRKDDVLHSIPRLVAPLRKALGDTTPASIQLDAISGAFTVGSLEAAHQVAIGAEQQFAGKFEEALQSFSKAVELDPSFSLAYAGMAGMAGNLGRQQDAEKYIQLAMQHQDRMSERERYRIRGLYYLRTSNWQKCIEEYGSLVNRYPADRAGQLNLAVCYGQMRNIPKAVDAAQRAVEIVPKGALQRLNLAFLNSMSADFAGAEREARAALQLNASEVGYLILAEAQLGEGQLPQAEDTYRSLEAFSAVGSSLASSGLGDLQTYEGKFSNALRTLEQGAAADLAAKNPENAGNKYLAAARVHLLRGNKRAAAVAAAKALANSQVMKTRFLAAWILSQAGEEAKAQKLAEALSAELQTEPQAYGKIVTGELALKKGDTHQAITFVTDANKLLDTWIGHYELGRIYLQAGLFVDADSEFDRCLKRRGEAMELFMDNAPTYNFLPDVYYYQGRVREGLKAPNFADSYRTYLSIRGQAGEDPLLVDLRHRLGQ